MAENNNTDLIGTLVEQVDATNILNDYFLGYAAYTISDRAIPKIEDGLKPVQRRVLYTMYNDLGLVHNKPTKKSAKVTGATLGSYHPHGDTSVYDAMINLSQDWKKRYPLVFVQGNNGSADNDPPAAARYTEARLTALGEYMMKDINKNTVDMTPNYDESTTEPTILPSLFINILCNGIMGTATGISSSMAPHYAKDVYKALDYIIESMLTGVNPDIKHIISIIKAPDFPTGGIIVNPADMENMYLTGRGRVIIRGKTEINADDNQIIITEIPYMVNKAKLVSDIGKVCLSDAATIEGVKDINDESDKDGIKIVIQLKRGADAGRILNNLYKKTDLQSSFSVNNTAIVNGKPMENITLQQMLVFFIRHVASVIRRKAQYELNEYNKRYHLVEGYLLAINMIDSIIENIKKATSGEEKLNNVMELGFDEIQAKAIISMSLGSISNMDETRFTTERDKLAENIAATTEIVNDNKVLLETCRKALNDFVESDILKDDKRRTVIGYDVDSNITDKDLVEEEDIIIITTLNGMIKAVKLSEYNTQRRNGKGVNLKTRDNDEVDKILTATTKDNLLVFTQLGKCHVLPIYKIPVVSKNAAAKYLVNYIDLVDGEEVVSVLVAKDNEHEKNLTMITKDGFVKKMSLDVITKRKVRSAAKVIEVREGDRLINVHLVSDTDKLFVVTKIGLGSIINISEIRLVASKTGLGMILMKLANSNEIVSSVVVGEENKDDTICIVTAQAFSKRIKINTMIPKNRGCKGQRVIGLTDNDYVVDATMADQKTLFIVSTEGMIIRIPTDSISIIGLAAKGIKSIKLDSGAVKSISAAPDSEEEPEQEEVEGNV